MLTYIHTQVKAKEDSSEAKENSSESKITQDFDA